MIDCDSGSIEIVVYTIWKELQDIKVAFYTYKCGGILLTGYSILALGTSLAVRLLQFCSRGGEPGN